MSRWSLVDNYEWGSYEPRFGIYGVDREHRVAVETFAQLGYKDIVELRGGMAASVESGRTLKAASG